MKFTKEGFEVLCEIMFLVEISEYEDHLIFMDETTKECYYFFPNWKDKTSQERMPDVYVTFDAELSEFSLMKDWYKD